MREKKIAVVVLAAGKSTRMKSNLTKVLHPVAGRALITYSIGEVLRLEPDKIVLVVGPKTEKSFKDVLGADRRIKYCVQKKALGTGDAVHSTKRELKNFKGLALIIPGDVPLISAETLNAFITKFRKEDYTVGVLSTDIPDPFSYGRIIRNHEGEFVCIREERDATEDERQISEINTGIIIVKSEWLLHALRLIKPHNAQKEYYLTDIVEHAIKDGRKVMAEEFTPCEEFIGVNNRGELSRVNKLMYAKIAKRWMSKGVSILDPDTTYIDGTVLIDENVTIMPNCFIRGATEIGAGSTIENGVVLTDMIIGENVHIKPYSVMEKSVLKDGVIAGPFARVRPDSILEKNVHIGNFVEVKKSHLKSGAKANHLTYLGDSVVGERTNVGCGTITCNYDGKNKHKTIIGDEVFIGSDVQFIAPVHVGSKSTIGAGSTITKNVPFGALALSRAPQVNVGGYYKRKKK